MEITPEQKVTSDNFKAHLLNLHTELLTVSRELEEKMRLKEVSSTEIEELSRIRENLLKDIKNMNIFLKEKAQSLNARVDFVLRREQQLFKDIKEFDERKYKELNIIQTETKNLETRLVVVKNEFIDSTIQLMNTENKITNTEEVIKGNNLVIDKLLYDIECLRQEYNELMINHSNAIKKSKNELKEWEGRIEDAKSKVDLPLAHLKEEELSFYKALNNLEVRKRRLAKYLKKYFPDEILKI